MASLEGLGLLMSLFWASLTHPCPFAGGPGMGTECPFCLDDLEGRGWGTERTHCLPEVSGKGLCLLILALASAGKRQTDRVLGLCLSCVPPLPWALWPQNCGTVESVELALLMSKWRTWGLEIRWWPKLIARDLGPGSASWLLGQATLCGAKWLPRLGWEEGAQRLCWESTAVYLARLLGLRWLCAHCDGIS